MFEIPLSLEVVKSKALGALSDVVSIVTLKLVEFGEILPATSLPIA